MWTNGKMTRGLMGSQHVDHWEGDPWPIIDLGWAEIIMGLKLVGWKIVAHDDDVSIHVIVHLSFHVSDHVSCPVSCDDMAVQFLMVLTVISIGLWAGLDWVKTKS